MTDLDAGVRDALIADGRSVAALAATKIPTGDEAVAAISSTAPRDISSTLVVDRLVQQVGIALTDVNASVNRRLDELQSKIDAIRGRLKAENEAARSRIESFVQLSTDAMVASKSLDDALERLDAALDGSH